jgi:nucleotide-binding universal stress UspA family protein
MIVKKHTFAQESPHRAIPSPAVASRTELAADLFKRILIPLGIGSESRALIGMAAALTTRYKSDIVLLQIMPHDTASASLAAANPEHLKRQLIAIENFLTESGAASVNTIILEGNPAYLVEQISREQDATVILFSGESDTAQNGAWFGTLPQRLAMRLTTPLLIMRPGAPITLKPILCVIDFSESSRLALKHSVSLARVHRSKLIVLNVVPEAVPYSIVEGPIWQNGGIVARRVPSSSSLTGIVNLQTSDHIAAAQIDLHNFLQDFDLTGIDYEVRVTYGLPVVQVLSEARDRKAGLISAGCSHRTGLVHLMSQNPAESLAETAEIPVLLFRAHTDTH